MEETVNRNPGLGVIVNSTYLLPLTAFSMEVVAQLVALNRSQASVAVRPAPRVILDEYKLASFALDMANASPPRNPLKSKVNICPQPVAAEIAITATATRPSRAVACCVLRVTRDSLPATRHPLPVSDLQSPIFAFRKTKGQNRFLISLNILEREIALFVQRDLFVADQRDGGVGGGRTGGGSRRLLDPLRLCAGDTEHPNQPDEE